MPPTVLLPVLPLRDIVAFPAMTMPLLVGRAKSLRACEAALAGDGRILLVAQRRQDVEEPSASDLYPVGVIAKLIEHLVLPGGRMKLLVRGERRARIVVLSTDAARIGATVQPMDSAEMPQSSEQPQFPLADWSAAPRTAGHVAELQRLLENGALSIPERLNAASKLIGSTG